MYPKQEAAIFNDARFAVIEASTKSGKTEGCIAWLYEQAVMGGPGQHFWWVAPSKGQADIPYKRLKLNGAREHQISNDSKHTIILSNGSTLTFRTGEDPDLLYGEDVYAVVMDEASRIREEAWWAVRSTLTKTKGCVRIIGNVKGRKNWAYRMARKAESGEPGYHYARITADDAVAAGVLEQKEIESARADLPERIFNELYFCEPGDDQGNPFGIAAIRACVGDLSYESPRVWGWDLAKAVDWTVGIALDADRHVCEFERWQGTQWGQTDTRIQRHTDGVAALVDSTGVGSPVVDRLQEQGGLYEGYLFTPKSKQHLMEALEMSIQDGSISFPDGPIVAELESFEYEYSRTGVRYSAPENMHDDCVCALALANWHYNAIPAPLDLSRTSAGGERVTAALTKNFDRRRVSLDIAEMLA